MNVRSVMVGLLLTTAFCPWLARADVYVSPQGSDAADGSATYPFASLEQARDAVRSLRSGSRSGTPMTVWLTAGDYWLPKSFKLAATDSDTIYRSAPGEPVRLRGGRPMAAADFHPVTNILTLARIAPAAQGKVLELDLNQAGLAHTGRYPDVFQDNGGLLDVYFKDRRMPLARFPNEGYMTLRRVLDNAGGLTTTNWSDSTWSDVRSNGVGGTFEYREAFYAEHARWQKVLDHGVWLKGYWRVPWENEAIRVQAIDTARHTVTFAKPIPGGIGSKYQRPQGSGREQYWLMNLLEAVDQPGEWCVDFKDHKLYFYPPAPLADGDVVIADNAEPLIELDGAANITLREMTVEQGLGNGIEVDNGSSNLVAGCTLRNLDGNGVVFAGGFRNELLSSDLYWLGGGGVWLSGGDENAQPRISAGHRVINNHIHDFAQIQRVYAAGINAGFSGGGGGGHHSAVGMFVAHNLIHDTPHVGILFGSWDSIYEYNEILEYCRVSNDMGAWYCYDLYSRLGNQTFRYNYVHASPEGDGVYFDHDHRDMHIYGNIIALDSRGKRGTGFLYKIGSQAGLPQSIDCTNNIAIHCHYGFEFVSALPSHIENNVTVDCQVPFTWQWVQGGHLVRTNDFFASGKNLSYQGDPGFANYADGDYRLRPDARIFRDLPGFQPIPFEKMGLYTDDYRRQLPTDEAAGRHQAAGDKEALGVEIKDRTY